MGNMETRQEVTGKDPEGEKDSRTAAETVRSQLSNPTIAGEKRHTVNEPRNPEIVCVCVCLCLCFLLCYGLSA